MSRRNNNSVIVVILLFFVLLVKAKGSDASILSKLLRQMMTEVVTTTKISPSPAPISDIAPNRHVDSGNSKPPVPLPNNSTHIDKDLDTDEKCNYTSSAVNKCIQGQMIACLKPSETGSQDLIILIQNEGESILTVSVIVPASVEVSTKELEIPQHQAKKITASTNVGESQNITLKAGNGDCVLSTGISLSEGIFFWRIPNHVTPMHGAYFMFMVAIVIGGTWACCKFGKKGQHGNGVPYQELEMAVPESASAVNVHAEDGWDQGWDDDWDEEKAVKSPGKCLGNLSANGLTSRSTNRDDGWENDWDE